MTDLKELVLCSAVFVPISAGCGGATTSPVDAALASRGAPASSLDAGAAEGLDERLADAPTDGPGCPEAPPTDGASCSAGGLICNYVTGYDRDGASESLRTWMSCCNGESGLWQPPPTNGCPTGNACGTIRASDYDQTCAVDGDCVTVDDGDLCNPNRCYCGSAVISARAEAQYDIDFSMRVSVVQVGHCPCRPNGAHFCDHGLCHLGSLL